MDKATLLNAALVEKSAAAESSLGEQAARLCASVIVFAWLDAQAPARTIPSSVIRHPSSVNEQRMQCSVVTAYRSGQLGKAEELEIQRYLL